MVHTRALLIVLMLLLVSPAFAGRSDDLVEEARGRSRKGDIGGAETKLKSALDADRTHVDANVEMGILKLTRNDLVAALQAFGDRALAAKMAESMAPLAILGGESVASVLSRLLQGTSLARLLPAESAVTAAPAEG